MDTSSGVTGDQEARVEEALRLAESDPRRALDLVATVEPGSGQDRLAGRMAWARGRAARQLGRLGEAGPDLRAAVDLLESAGDTRGASEASVALALERIDAGQFDEAIALIERAGPWLNQRERARALIQKGLALQRSGREIDALDCWNTAADACTAAGMIVEAGVARQNRGIVQAYRGDFEQAEVDLQAAAEVFAAEGQDIRAMEAEHNLGFVAALRGDVPTALARFDAAQARAGRLGVLRPQALVDRVQVTLDAGLVAEGRALSESAVELLQKGGFDADVPEAALLAARSCELDGDMGAAARWAARAGEWFEQQHRPRWSLLARLAELRVTAADRPDALIELAGDLRRAGWFAPAIEAETRAAAVLIESPAHDRAHDLVHRLTATAGEQTPLSRLQIYLVEAQLSSAEGDLAGARRALIDGLAALRAFLATLGSLELRSRGGGRADELMSIGLRIAARAGRPDDALRWTEAVRQTTRAQMRPADDPEIARLLNRLRGVTEEINREDSTVAQVTRLRQRQAAVEEIVRRYSRHHSGDTGLAVRPMDRAAFAETFAGRVLVSFAVTGDRLLAIVADGDDRRIIDMADRSAARRAVAGLRLALGAAISSGTGDRSLRSAARAAGALLLPAFDRPPASGYVIVPEGALASVPWALLPGLVDADVTVASSATAWMDAHRECQRPPARPRVLLVAGPDLQHADEEVDRISRLWPDVTVLRGREATVERVLAELTDSDLVHVAAHGTHRGDNPMLSGIRLSDGHLTGYELATAEKRAAVVVLSCCDTGMADTSSGLGLGQVLTQTGVGTALASVSPVADSSAVGLMTALHRALADRVPPSSALAMARRQMGGPYASPSSAGFVCFGGG
ncbi:MAG TPA: CHAT domain-containing tetratricopeptide repeat protein [Acidimicrobiales bacterium]|nr:CHAT domain-containing tetratricopeptide repeat protein [Acidimicrobiales bacterium]